MMALNGRNYQLDVFNKDLRHEKTIFRDSLKEARETRNEMVARGLKVNLFCAMKSGGVLQIA